MKQSLLFIPIVLTVVASSCNKYKQFPTVPEITFTSYTVSDVPDSVLTGNIYKNAHLKFSFKDAEGDIGLDQGDTSAPYDKNNFYNNLYITLYVKKNGSFQMVKEIGSRIPTDLTEYAGKKGLQGYIEIDRRETSLKVGDVVRYDIFIYDRALNKSNVTSSPEITI